MVKGYKDYSRATMSATIEIKQRLDFLTEGLSISAMGSTSRYSFFDVNRYYTPFYYQLVPGSFDRKTGAYSVDVINSLDRKSTRLNSCQYCASSISYID